MQYFVGEQEYFKGIGKIQFEGKGSKNPLAFKYYDAKKVIAGKTMEEHLRFATAYWHSFCADGTDPFGNSTIDFPFRKADKYANAIAKADAALNFSPLGTPFSSMTLMHPPTTKWRRSMRRLTIRLQTSCSPVRRQAGSNCFGIRPMCSHTPTI